VLMGVEAICFHNWLVSVSGGVRARRCVLLVSIGSKPTLGGDPGAWWQMAKGQTPRKLCLLAQASGCEGRQARYTAARRTSDTLRTTLWIASSIVKCIFNSFPSFFSPRSVASRCCFCSLVWADVMGEPKNVEPRNTRKGAWDSRRLGNMRYMTVELRRRWIGKRIRLLRTHETRVEEYFLGGVGRCVGEWGD